MFLYKQTVPLDSGDSLDLVFVIPFGSHFHPYDAQSLIADIPFEIGVISQLNRELYEAALKSERVLKTIDSEIYVYSVTLRSRFFDYNFDFSMIEDLTEDSNEPEQSNSNDSNRG